MAAKQILFAQEVRAEMLKGIDILADAVKETLGPKGRNVLIEKSWGAPTVTKDGVTVAKWIDLENKFQDLGAKMVREVATKTSDTAGDGTTTATVLAQAIYREGLKAVSAGMDPMDLKRGIDRATAEAVEALEGAARPCEDTQSIVQVGTISANADEAIGQILADAMEAIIAAIYLDGGYQAAYAMIEHHFADLFDAVDTGAQYLDHKSELQEVVQFQQMPTPEYQIVGESGPDHDKTFSVQVKIGDLRAWGHGKSKKAAEQDAARNVLNQLTP